MTKKSIHFEDPYEICDLQYERLDAEDDPYLKDNGDGERWVDIPGYKFLYQVSNTSKVRKQLDNGAWRYLKGFMNGRGRVCVKMVASNGEKKNIPLVWLVADAFMDGRKPGLGLLHLNGSKFDCSPENLQYATLSECGKRSGKGRRKAVVKLDRHKNVVEIYASIKAAADANYMSKSSMSDRVNRKLKNPYHLDGYDYRFEHGRRLTK